MNVSQENLVWEGVPGIGAEFRNLPMNINELRKNYSGMTDRQILNLVSEANTLAKDGQVALKEEMEKRKIDKNAVDMGLAELSGGETDKLIKDFTNSLCPICFSKVGINGVYVYGFLSKDFILGCSDCLKKSLRAIGDKLWQYVLLAILLTGLPLIIVIIFNNKNKKALEKISNNNLDELIIWVKENKSAVYQHLYKYKSIACYNRGCVSAHNGDKAEALKSLAEAIRYDTGVKAKVKQDPDFKTLWDDEEFKKLVN